MADGGFISGIIIRSSSFRENQATLPFMKPMRVISMPFKMVRWAK